MYGEPTRSASCSSSQESPASSDPPSISPRVNTRQAVLRSIKRRAAMSAKQLSEQLGITVAGVRQHLIACEHDGLVESEPLRGGPGRPSLMYSLTEQGQRLFGQRYERLVVEILEGARRIGGDELIEMLFAERHQRQLERYRPIAQEPNPAEKLRMLAALRDEEGFMANLETSPSGDAILVEYHCPIATLAKHYPAICDRELNLLTEVLGPDVKVVRCEHALETGHACRYTIRIRR